MRLFLWLLLSVSIMAAPVVIYDTDTHRVKEFKQRANTPEYQGRPDVVIFTVPYDKIPLVQANIPIKYWMVENHNIREMTDEEKSVVDSEIDSLQAQKDLEDAVEKQIELQIRLYACQTLLKNKEGDEADILNNKIIECQTNMESASTKAQTAVSAKSEILKKVQ
jgi:hypothetical protein